MKEPLVGLLYIVILIAIASSFFYALVSGAAWAFFVWFVSSNVAVSVFLGTLITITLLLFLATRQGVRR
jgi:nitrogen fixation/metabolism regulation signal transduction histidine kinase